MKYLYKSSILEVILYKWCSTCCIRLYDGICLSAAHAIGKEIVLNKIKIIVNLGGMTLPTCNSKGRKHVVHSGPLAVRLAPDSTC